MKTKIFFIVILISSLSQLHAQIGDFNSYKTYNYVYSKTVLLLTTGSAEYKENFQYVDGLGRPSQTVAYKGSPLLKDIIQPIEYDFFGRESIKYLPYTSTSTATGIYRSTWKTEQSAFYTGLYGPTDGTKAFSQTVFDKSPLNRIMKQGAPGIIWQPITTSTVRQTSEHITSFQYATNTSNEVYYWAISGTYPDVIFTRKSYAANELYKNVVYDENNNPLIEYKDKQNKVVLKIDALSGKTYYIYDDSELLRCVIPPLASQTLVTSSTFLLSNTICMELCYYYEYDYRQHMIIKKLPGTIGVYTMTYDNLGRLRESTDPNGTRNYTDYDAFSRPIETGIYINGVKTWQIKTYYDTYVVNGVDYSLSTNFKYNNIYGYTNETMIKGKSALTKTKVLNPGPYMKTELISITYYDKYGRVIQSISENHKNGLDRISHLFKFKNAEDISETRYEHCINFSTYSQTVIEKFEYDHAGRLKVTKHKINALSEETLATMNYNEAGQLITKNINTLQTVDYKYNIRNWLTQINDPIEYNSTDLFSMRLTYTGNSNNGNINKMEWTNPMAGLVKVYELNYDQLNRLTSGAYLEYDHGVYLPGATGKYVESFSYDANGNTITAQRNGVIDDGAGLIGTIDILNYKYYNNDKSNRLKAVGDFIPDVFGRGDFNEYNSDGNATQEYWYDNNGNMIKDQNRNSISYYNYLNLPYKVNDWNGNTILTFIYSADGQKLHQEIFRGATNCIGTSDYIGPFIYRNGVLSFVVTSEGLALYYNRSLNYYEFHLKDHLGNVRTVFKKNGSVPQVLQKNDYYSFGMLQGESTNEAYDNMYLYNGKQQINAVRSGYGVDISMYDYGARFYDPQIGRWHSVDPLAEETKEWSSYNFCLNNPIKNIDPDGMYTLYGAEAQSYFRQLQLNERMKQAFNGKPEQGQETGDPSKNNPGNNPTQVKEKDPNDLSDWPTIDLNNNGSLWLAQFRAGINAYKPLLKAGEVGLEVSVSLLFGEVTSGASFIFKSSPSINIAANITDDLLKAPLERFVSSYSRTVPGLLRAPSGGIIRIGGKIYEGGQFIPKPRLYFGRGVENFSTLPLFSTPWKPSPINFGANPILRYGMGFGGAALGYIYYREKTLNSNGK